MSTARRTEIILNYEGVDITADVSRFITGFQYSDVTVSDEMDALAVNFENVAGLWSGGWFPERGAKLQAAIECHNWFKPGETLRRECGTFEIDDITDEGPPSTFTISALAVGITHPIRRQENSQPWENIPVRTILNEIAAKNGFELKWYSNYNPTIDRMDQDSESDLAFLRKVCDYAGLRLKITDNAIVAFRGEEFDANPPELTIRRGVDGLSHYRFNASSADVYSACSVSYYDPAANELLEYLYVPDGISGSRGGQGGGGASSDKGAREYDEETRMEIAQTTSRAPEIQNPAIGQVLKINQRVSSLAEAEELAKASLRNKNMRQVKATLDFMGNIKLYSGMNVLVDGFGRWDAAPWQIEKIIHDYTKSGGLRTTAELRGILNGY